MLCQNKQIMRVAAYCRVSTDKDDQINSLQSQKRYFTEYILRNPGWELIEVYADEGVTGTSTKKRHEFNRMIDEASKRMFDLIITKEISRFARNTLDSIFYTRKLREIGIGVIFMNDGINTLDADAELRLTIMSSIAQEESRKTSDRVKWGQRRQMEQGVVFGRNLLGYDVRNGNIFVNEEGAEIVRLIFHKFLIEGKGTHIIARELREDGIRTASYMTSWSNTAILRILRNEKYCGDLVQKKTYTPSYLNHEKKYNKGEEDFIIIKNHHEPIIERETFEKTRAELNKRALFAANSGKHSNRYCFSGKIKCGLCGERYVSLTKTNANGSVYKAWRCAENAKNGGRRTDCNGVTIGCSNISVNDAAMKDMLTHIMKIVGGVAGEQTAKTIESAVLTFAETSVKNKKDAEKKLLAAEKKKRRLIELYTDGEITKDEFQSLRAKCDAQIKSVNSACEYREYNYDKECGLKNIRSVIRALISGEEWDDTFYGNILENITVYKNSVELKLRGSEDFFVFAYQ